MENKPNDINDKPPFFKKWSGLYLFILGFELFLILLFIWITNTFNG
ncbi:MAG: hypothetical protein HND54_10370 [Bacteroidetes bacterium]|nr:hypothetical protein [Bacteroidota bacterium]